jgi:hypothetical protein
MGLLIVHHLRSDYDIGTLPECCLLEVQDRALDAVSFIPSYETKRLGFRHDSQILAFNYQNGIYFTKTFRTPSAVAMIAADEALALFAFPTPREERSNLFRTDGTFL